MSESFHYRDVQAEADSQYGNENLSLYADARRELYKYSEDGVDIWHEMAEVVAAFGARVVFDAATGSAILPRRILETGARPKISGMDINRNNYFVAEATFPEEFPDADVDFFEGDVTNLSTVEDGSVDVVTSAYVNHHLAVPRLAVREYFRVLKPGGLLVQGARDAENQERIWRLGGLLADKTNATRPQSFYTHCDITKTKEITSEIFGTGPEYTYIQDSTLRIPYEAWSEVRLAVLSLWPEMRDKNDPSVLSPSKDFNRILDTDILKIFQQEIVGFPGMPGKGAFMDRVRQGFVVHRKAA